MKNKLKVGCIGLGPRGRYLFKTLIGNPNVQAYAVCDNDLQKLNEYKNVIENENKIYDVQYFTAYEDLLNTDVEAIIVATNISTHCDIAVACLNAGKHVLCEIPNIANLEEAKKLYAAVKANPKQKFMVAENCCYWAFIHTWKKMYEDGLLGDIVYAESDYLHPHTSVVPNGEITWRSFLPAVTYMTHNLGPLLYILEDTCEEIYGFIPGINPIEKQHPAPPDGVAMIKTKKGTLIKIFIGFGVQHEEINNYSIYGSKGSVEKERRKGGGNSTTYAFLESIPNTYKEIEIPVGAGFKGYSKEGHGGADPKMMEAFVNCILQDTKPPLDIEFGINIALPGIFADISSKNGNKCFKMPNFEEIL